MTNADYHSLNFACKRLIDRCKKEGRLPYWGMDVPDRDRCKVLEKRGFLKAVYGGWSGNLSSYELV